MRPESILVTGGAGFVGSALAIALKGLWPTAQVFAFDNLRRRGSELNVSRLGLAGVEFIHGDVRSAEDVGSIAQDVNLIIACAAEPSAQAGYGESPDYVIRTNLLGCFHCLELARRRQAAFIFISTSRVYPYGAINNLGYVENYTRFCLQPAPGTPGASRLGIGEDFPLAGARSIYGMTKLASELMVQEYGDAYGLAWITNRCGLIAGPWQMGKTDQGIVSFWMAAHYHKRPLSYIGFGGGGKQVRDIIHIQDICDLVTEQITHFDAYQGHVYNVGGGSPFSLSLAEMTVLCGEMTGNQVPISAILETRPADVRIYATDTSRVSAVRGWRPKRDAGTTLADTYAWLHCHEGVLAL